MRVVKNKEGYTLTYAIIIIALLLILVSSVIMVTYMNLKHARLGGQINTSFYASDGATEEALTELSNFTYNAEVYAWSQVNAITPTLWNDFFNSITIDINNDVLTVDQGNQIVADALRGVYETSFYNYLLKNTPASHAYYDTIDGLGVALEGTDKYNDFGSYKGVVFDPLIVVEFQDSIKNALNTTIFSPTNIISVTGGDIVDTDIISYSLDTSTNIISLELTSDGTYHKQNKKLTVNLEILPPAYNFSVSTLTNNFSLYKNEITELALVAQGDIIFESGDTTINGDVYAYGSRGDIFVSNNTPLRPLSSIDFRYDQPRATYGGVIIDNSNVVVTGDVSTRNSVKMEHDNSNLTIGDSIFANSLYISPGTDGTSIAVANDIYLYSDLYIGGGNADIKIGDSTTDEVASGSISSYVPTNGNLIGLLAGHPIAGEDYTRTGSIIVRENIDAPSISLQGLFLNGVVRYDFVKQDTFITPEQYEAYRTGESFTTYANKNYYQSLNQDSIYQSGVISSLENYIINQAVSSTDPDNLLQLIQFNKDIDNISSLDQKTFRAIHFFTMGYHAFTEREALGAQAPYKINDISIDDKSIIEIRNPVRVGVTQFYGVNANGLIQFKDTSTGKAKIYHPDIIDTTSLSNNIATFSRNIDLKANLLGYSFYENLGADTYSEIKLLWSWLDETATSSTPSDLTASKLAIYNNVSSKDIYINNPTDVSGAINLRGGSRDYIGTIVTKGNVYIYAASGETVTFNGNIISEKNIYFTGTGTKVITNNEDEIYDAIFNNAFLQNLYHTKVVEPIDAGREVLPPDALPVLPDVLPADLGRSISIDTGIGMFNNNLELKMYNGISAYQANYVDEIVTGGTTVVNGRSIKINSWKED